MPDAPLFSIFTATYNRRNTLERVFRSLERQTSTDFEWLVVDDGSTDGTERAIAEFAERATFRIVYLDQPNRGKYRAWNAGVKAASGRFIANLDSDDAMLPQGLETLLRAWEAIPDDQREGFVGVTGLCVDEAGNVVGDIFPEPIFDSSSAIANFRLGIRGDKAGFVRRDVALAHLFPEHLRTRFIPEGRIWLDIARHYKTRYINEPILVIHDNGGARLSALARPQRAHGDLEHNRFVLDHYAMKFPRQGLKSAVLMARAGSALDLSFLELVALPTSLLGKLAVACGYPAASLLHRFDLIREYGKLGLLTSISRSLPSFLGQSAIREAAAGLIPPHERQVEINVLSFRMCLNLRDSFERSVLLFPRSHLTPGVRFLSEALRESGTFIDLHAGAGFYALYMSRNLEHGRVFAIEADGARRGRLLRSIAISSAHNISVCDGSACLNDLDAGKGALPQPLAVRIDSRTDAIRSLESLFAALPARIRPDLVLLAGERATRESAATAEWLLVRGFHKRLDSRSECVLMRDHTALGAGHV